MKRKPPSQSIGARAILAGLVAAAAMSALVTAAAGAEQTPAERKAEFVNAVVRGEGYAAGQPRGISAAEKSFRATIERRKDELLAGRIELQHPVLLTGEELAEARRKIDAADWARRWYRRQKALADDLVGRGDDFVRHMLPELTPTNSYGLTCPHCVGRKSQEAVGSSLMAWSYQQPDQLTCRRCGQVYPSDRYPETARLVCPRSGQVFTYYLNQRERDHPQDHSGRYAWHWVGYPIHVSFTGAIRERKIGFMMRAARSLALVYRLTGDARYAGKAVQILVRLAGCYRRWLYHDYWDTIADCDPIYAAYHDKNLPLPWKRHLAADAYRQDTWDRAAMRQNYWGAGRAHPSTDAISNVRGLALAYDLVAGADDGDGRPLCSAADRAKVERDLLLEYVMGAEPYVGGPGKATCVNNKAPRIYQAQAVVARCLGLVPMADTALRGYEAVRDQSFLADGFSRESPAYTNMYLSALVLVPETLQGFRWPADYGPRHGVVDLFQTDARLRLMFRAMIDLLRPDGRYPPLSDTSVTSAPAVHLVELGRRHYPQYYAAGLAGNAVNDSSTRNSRSTDRSRIRKNSDSTANGPNSDEFGDQNRSRRRLAELYRGRDPSEYALFHLSSEQIGYDGSLALPEVCFPAWGTAILRHGKGPAATMLTMAFSPAGGHRHHDNLALFYSDRGQVVLGDHGYVGDMPVNAWIKSGLSHNLVVVDGADQPLAGRRPQLRRFITSPRVSAVEASAQVYPQCRQYRRLVVLIKGPAAETFAVDIFRVKGSSSRHTYRLFSELAASDAAAGALELTGLALPAERPLPVVGTSLARADIFGLRDGRRTDDPPAAWQATWRQPERQFRVWVLTQADWVEAANGPGQETLDQAGRRVRYLDIVRAGKDLDSTFVVVHEPSGPNGAMPIHSAERLPVPAAAGPAAVAVRIDSAWGTYLVLSDFAQTAEVAGVEFAGKLGIFSATPAAGRWLLAVGGSRFRADDFGFDGATASWSGKIVGHSQTELVADSAQPADWQPPPDGVTTCVLVGEPGSMQGFPVRAIKDNRIEVRRFPLPEATRFLLENVRLVEQP